MTEKDRRIWNDPVWSKVIAGGILAGLATLGGLLTRATSRFFWIVVPLWGVVVVAASAFVTSVLLLRKRRRETYGFDPNLKLLGVEVPNADPNQKWTFPVKCYFKFRNDSAGCVDVKISEFEPQAIILKSQAIAVLQVQFHQEWLPADHGMDRVSVLPGQLLQGWIAPDEAKFSSQNARDLLGKLGTLHLLVNGEVLTYQL
jgi:hypothetical protein